MAKQRTRFHHEVTDTVYEHYLTRRLRAFTLWVRFHPDLLPVTVQSFTVKDGVHSEHQVRLGGASGAQLVLRDVGPGRAGIRWAWGAPD